MAQVEAIIVPRFNGIKRPGLSELSSDRRPIDTPREMYNFHLTPQGYLYMPPAPDELIHTFEGEGEIMAIRFISDPSGLLVQCRGGKIFYLPTVPGSSVILPDPVVVNHIATIPSNEREWRIWSNGISGATLFGYAPRGTPGADTDGKTWSITGSRDDFEVIDLTDSLEPTASYSQMHKGRRFWVKRGRRVYFSDLNSPELPAEEPENNTFLISGDDTGDTYIHNPGHVQGMTSWEDVLIFFLSGSVWMLVGDSPENFNLRQVQTIAGNDAPFAINRVDGGVITFGGSNLNDRGVYLFTGSNAVKLSRDIDSWLSTDPGVITSATAAGNTYIISTSRDDEDERQFLVYNMDTQQWTAFDGYEKGVVSTQFNRILVSSDESLYRIEDNMFPRARGRGAKVTLGYHDDENPTGMVRFLGVKLSGKQSGSNECRVRITAHSPRTAEVQTPWVIIPSDTFDEFVIPLNIRGPALEFELEIESKDDADSVLIENLQIVLSRKGEKISRGRGVA